MARVKKTEYEFQMARVFKSRHELKAVARVKKSWHELFTGTSGTTGTSVKAIALCILVTVHAFKYMTGLSKP